MKLQEWEGVIQQTMDDFMREPMESGKHKVLTACRAKLGKAPHSLQPYQIDEIIREVRKRVTRLSLEAVQVAQSGAVAATVRV